jgi:hypothetical protein
MEYYIKQKKKKNKLDVYNKKGQKKIWLLNVIFRVSEH